MRRRQIPFAPSLVLSLVLNFAVFATMQPVKGDGTPRPRLQLHRLTGVAVQGSLARTPVALPTTEPAAQVAPTPPAPQRQATRQPPAPRAATGGTRRGAAPGRAGGGDGSARVSPNWRADQRNPGGRALGPTGGDGTRATPQIRNSGGGDPIEAVAIEPGTPDGPAGQPALGGNLAAVPRAGLTPTAPGPPVISPGPGTRGGTPLGPTIGVAPRPGTAGSGDDPSGIAPQTTAGWSRPLAPTTDGERLRAAGGRGLPVLPGGVRIPNMPVDPDGTSGGGGGTAAVVGAGGGGPQRLAAAPRDTSRGGGGSGMVVTGPGQPGGVAIGPGPGGSGGGGTGFQPEGGGSGVPGGSRISLAPATTGGAPSVLSQPGRGTPGATPVRPGARVAGPGGAPVDVDPADARGSRADGGRGGSGGGTGRGDGAGDGDGGGRGPGSGPGSGGGTGGGSGRGGGGLVATKGSDDDGGPTGVIVDTLAHKWHHYPGSYDLHIGSAEGPRIATIGIIHYRSVASARAGSQVARGGRRDPIVIRPLGIKFVVGSGQGARQRVIISQGDADKLRASGLLRQPGKIVTVWRDNIE